ncbi:hypothetical protein SAMN02745866_01098 [Alteromonadaceae bacterium Bs31]|nr:hypothetical protein SAMN02745866_01098 [Alteromonadaceae bacterium Bs31]
MKKGVVLGVLLLSAGCAQMFPAVSRELTPGVYQIQATANSFASVASLKQKVAKKAGKICGEAGYEQAESADYDVKKQTTYTNGSQITSHYQVYTETIKCKQE